MLLLNARKRPTRFRLTYNHTISAELMRLIATTAIMTPVLSRCIELACVVAVAISPLVLATRRSTASVSLRENSAFELSCLFASWS